MDFTASEAEVTPKARASDRKPFNRTRSATPNDTTLEHTVGIGSWCDSLQHIKRKTTALVGEGLAMTENRSHLLAGVVGEGVAQPKIGHADWLARSIVDHAKPVPNLPATRRDRLSVTPKPSQTVPAKRCDRLWITLNPPPNQEMWRVVPDTSPTVPAKTRDRLSVTLNPC